MKKRSGRERQEVVAVACITDVCMYKVTQGRTTRVQSVGFKI